MKRKIMLICVYSDRVYVRVDLTDIDGNIWVNKNVEIKVIDCAFWLFEIYHLLIRIADEIFIVILIPLLPRP